MVARASPPGRSSIGMPSVASGPKPWAPIEVGQVQGPALFMSGKLKLTGDLMFGAQVQGFFETPKAR
jgi:hypothetical protein